MFTNESLRPNTVVLSLDLCLEFLFPVWIDGNCRKTIRIPIVHFVFLRVGRLTLLLDLDTISDFERQINVPMSLCPRSIAHNRIYRIPNFFCQVRCNLIRLSMQMYILSANSFQFGSLIFSLCELQMYLQYV